MDQDISPLTKIQKSIPATFYFEVFKLVGSIMARFPHDHLMESFLWFCLHQTQLRKVSSRHFLDEVYKEKRIYSFYKECLGITQDYFLSCSRNENIGEASQKCKARFQALLNNQEATERTGNERFYAYYQDPSSFQRYDLEDLAGIVLKDVHAVYNGKLKYFSDATTCIHKVIEKIQPNSLHTIDVTKTAEKALLWAEKLPRVIPFYAIKANSDPIIVNAYASLGFGFDCASEAEIKQVIGLGAHPDRIIFANPRKFESAIEFAQKVGLKKIVLDSKDEFFKMYKIYPEGEYVIRIKTDDSHSAIPFSAKFGASMDCARELTKLAYENKVKLVGISFHVGSNCKDPNTYHKALQDAATLFKEAKENYGMEMNLLDIGGGWPGYDDETISFASLASVVNKDLEKYFDSTVHIIAEPGRYLCSEVEQQIVRIIGTSEELIADTKETKLHYYLSNGAYQSFLNCMYFKFQTADIKTEGICLQPYPTSKKDATLYKSMLWGPTCDSGDKLLIDELFPKMKTGDYFYSLHTGAYNNAMNTHFNGIYNSTPFYYYSHKEKGTTK